MSGYVAMPIRDFVNMTLDAAALNARDLKKVKARRHYKTSSQESDSHACLITNEDNEIRGGEHTDHLIERE